MRQLQEIHLTQLKVPKQNVRTYNTDKGMGELKVNIKSIGLIEPISVHKELDQYVVLAGQRRLNAYHELNEEYPNQGFDKIECLVTDSPKDDDMRRAISLGENITHLSMSKEDLKSAVTELYNKCDGDYKKVKERFGLTKPTIDKYVRLSRLPEKIKQSIKDGGIHTKQNVAETIALKAVDALQWTKDGDVSEDKVLELANTMSNTENIGIKDDIVSETKKNPNGSISDNVNRARNNTHETIILKLEPELNSKLERYSETEGDDSKTVTALGIISEKLNSESD